MRKALGSIPIFEKKKPTTTNPKLISIIYCFQEGSPLSINV
jgi:hypothetical protein